MTVSAVCVGVYLCKNDEKLRLRATDTERSSSTESISRAGSLNLTYPTYDAGICYGDVWLQCTYDTEGERDQTLFWTGNRYVRDLVCAYGINNFGTILYQTIKKHGVLGYPYVFVWLSCLQYVYVHRTYLIRHQRFSIIIGMHCNVH